jgi:CheY-like chemotaxis protein
MSIMEAHGTRPRVLYVDDDEMYAELAKTHLDQGGDYDVHVEHSSLRALDRIMDDQFDVIVTEYEMPGMNGLQLLAKIKELDMIIPMIIFTRQEREALVIDALRKGADFCLHKGGSPEVQFAELGNMILRSLMLAQLEKRLTISEERYRQMMSALETANRKLNLLGSITRHDLMNQLTTLFGHLEIAKMEVDDPELEERLEKAILVGENIKHFLDFGGDYEQMGTHEPDWISVADAFEKGLSTVEIQGVSVHSKLGGLEIFSDSMLEKVFHNLLDNSCRHSGNLNEINVYFEMMDSGMKVVYEDDGMGIHDELKSRLFDGSMGHGLFLVREILGITEIGIEETGVPGEGARFEILVPDGRYRLIS